MLVEFEYWLSYGKGHTGEATIEAEITDEEYDRLKKTFLEFGEDFYAHKTVSDIYDRLWNIANKDATSCLSEEGLLEEGEKASDKYPIEVCYPFSYEDFDEDELDAEV
jgi:hypothetical protein